MPETFKIAAIGHTGAGHYGHHIHTSFVGIRGAVYTAIADPDEAGRTKAAGEVGAPRTYADYRELLERERPDIVCVCPRWADQREAMIGACLQAGCHVYTEKPAVMTLAEADRLIAQADAAGLKVAVAHQAVYLPQIHAARARLGEWIGELQAIHAYGKQDHRGGGEDMLVLGTHLFNLMRFFAGDVAWMAAHVTQGGRDIGPSDVHPASEPVGLIAGDAVSSTFAFAGGAVGAFTSRVGPKSKGRAYGFELVGNQGRLAIGGNAERFTHYADPVWSPWSPEATYQPLAVEIEPLMAGNALAARDLIDAIEGDRRPICSLHDARAALEMVHGAYAAQIAGGRVALPLREREHPLARWVQSERSSA